MHDAQNLFDSKTSYAGEWNIDEKLDNAELIVIGIEHGNDKRMDELTPYKNDKYGGGMPTPILSLLSNTKPQIDQSTELRQKEKYINYG
jgi:alpha-glucosidase